MATACLSRRQARPRTCTRACRAAGQAGPSLTRRRLVGGRQLTQLPRQCCLQRLCLGRPAAQHVGVRLPHQRLQQRWGLAALGRRVQQLRHRGGGEGVPPLRKPRAGPQRAPTAAAPRLLLDTRGRLASAAPPPATLPRLCRHRQQRTVHVQHAQQARQRLGSVRGQRQQRGLSVGRPLPAPHHLSQGVHGGSPGRRPNVSNHQIRHGRSRHQGPAQHCGGIQGGPIAAPRLCATGGLRRLARCRPVQRCQHLCRHAARVQPLQQPGSQRRLGRQQPQPASAAAQHAQQGARRRQQLVQLGGAHKGGLAVALQAVQE